MPTTKFTSIEEISALITHFEIGDWPHSQWTHGSHLVMAFWYLSRLDEAEAIERIRSGIQHYNDCQGTPSTDTSGYHETLTLFWIRIVAKFLKDADASWSELEAANRLVETYADRSGLWREYYSFDVVRSVEARKVWIAPDRRDL